jgi:hypothetical protein
MKEKGFMIRNERGAAGLKAIIAIVILIAVIYTGIQLIPIYLAQYNFEDKVKGEITLAFVNYPQDTQKKLESAIMGMLNDMGATYDKKNVRVKVGGDQSAKKIVAEVWYSRTVDLPFFPNPKQFYVKVENKPIE